MRKIAIVGGPTFGDESTSIDGPSTRLRVLGSMELVDEQAVMSITGRPAGVLAVLVAASPNWISAEVLIDEIWSETANVTPGALHQAVMRLRKRLGEFGQYLQGGDLGYRLDTSSLEIDVLTVQACLDAGETALDGGRLSDATKALAGIEVEWRGVPFGSMTSIPRVGLASRQIVERRLSFIERTVSATNEMAETAADGGADQSSWLLGLCEQEPYRETLWLVAAQVHHRWGRTVEAIQMIATLRDQLAELGLAPTKSVRQFEALLFEATVSELPADGRAIALPDDFGVLPSFWGNSYCGRAREVRLLKKLLRRPDDAGSSVVLAGAPGTGKTHLAAIVLQDQLSQDKPALVVSFDPSGFADRDLDLLARSPEDRLLIIVEDLQWADAEGLAAVAATLLRPGRSQTTLLTARTGIGSWQAWLDRFGLALSPIRIDLDNLDLDAIRELVLGLGGDLALLKPQMLIALTGGNPFLVSEVVKWWIETGSVPGVGPAEGAIGDLLNSRIATLAPDTIDVLEWVAVGGGTIDVEVLASALDRTVLQLSELLESALERGLVRERSVGVVQLCHELMRQQFLARLSTLRRSAMHRALSDALSELSRALLVVESLRHLAATGEAAPSLDAALAQLALAREWMDQNSWARAAEAARRSAQIARAADANDDETQQLIRVIGQAHLVTGEAAEALNVMATTRTESVAAMVHALAAGDEETAIGAGVLSLLALSPGEPQEGMIEAIANGFVSIDPTVNTQAALRSVQIVHESARPGILSLRRVMEFSTELTEASNSLERSSTEVVDDVITRCRLLIGEGLSDIGTQLSLANQRVSRHFGPTTERLDSLLHRTTRLIAGGDRPGVDRDVQAMIDLAIELDHRDFLTIGSQIRGALAMADGRVEDAHQHVTAAMSLCGDHPINVEIGLVQQWWMAMNADPVETVELSVGIAEANPHRPVMAGMAALNHCLVGEHEQGQVILEAILPLDREQLLPVDVTYVVGLAGFLRVACEVRSLRHLDRLEPALQAYDGQLIFAVGFAFPFGSVARYLAIAAATRGDKAKAQAKFERALALETQFGGSALVADTERAMEQWL